MCCSVLQCVCACCSWAPSGPLEREAERGFREREINKQGALALVWMELAICK